jgi:diadenosine tetraphosphate (Ap4A) HIT family hydrolase
MVGRVLTGNGVTSCGHGLYTTNWRHASLAPCDRRADLHQPEWNAVVELLKQRHEQLSAEDIPIRGWNVGLNSGETAGQTSFHAHWHLIPERQGDCEQPRGVVRGVIAGRQSY